MAATEALVIAARDGDEGAFEQLVELHRTETHRLCRMILGSSGEAQDAAQEAFVRAWRDLPKLRDTSRWAAWFRRATVRAAIDQSRRRRVREITLDAAAAGGSLSAPDPTAGIAGRRDLADAFARLDASDRAVLSLRYGADLEVPDVAASLGIPLGTAKSRIHRALDRLRKQLGEDASTREPLP